MYNTRGGRGGKGAKEQHFSYLGTDFILRRKAGDLGPKEASFFFIFIFFIFLEPDKHYLTNLPNLRYIENLKTGFYILYRGPLSSLT